MRSAVLRATALLAWAVFAAPLLTGCKIVPIADVGQVETKTFDGPAYAQNIWTSKALPFLSSSAKPLPQVLSAIRADLNAAGETFGYRPATEGSPWTFVVAATGTVTKINTTSRAGTLSLAVEGMAPADEVTVQIGPVVKGNAVRDALPFVSFKDFVNQLEFADAGKALTALALAAIAPTVTTIAVGDKVELLGATSPLSAAAPLLVTPVSLKVIK